MVCGIAQFLQDLFVKAPVDYVYIAGKEREMLDYIERRSECEEEYFKNWVKKAG